MRALVAFVRLSRPLFLYGGFAGVALGAVLAARSGYRIGAPAYAGVQLLVTAFQLMVHYANDFFDRHGDRVPGRTPWSGGSGVLVEGSVPPRVALAAALACAAAGLTATAHFAWIGNRAVALIGVAMGALAWAYSAPPLRLAARGFGEFDAAVIVGVLVPAAGFAAFAAGVDGTLARPAAVLSAAMLAMMLSVELPDAGTDHATGKRTLVVRLGVSTALNLLVVSAAVSLLLNLGTVFGLGTAICGLASVPAVACGVALLWRARGDPRPAAIAFWGVAFYAATVTGLAVAYAVAGG